MLEDEDDDDEDDDDDDKDDDEVEGKFAVNVVCSSIHVSFFFFAFLVFMHSHLFLLSQWAFFQITHHLPCVYAFTSFPVKSMGIVSNYTLSFHKNVMKGEVRL